MSGPSSAAVPPAPVPLPKLGRVLAAGLAAARQDLLRARGPELPAGSTFAREVRIAARRLRTLLAPLASPAGRGPVPGLRRVLAELLDGLSEDRDLEVVVQWLTRDEGWRTGEELARRDLLERLGVSDPGPAAGPGGAPVPPGLAVRIRELAGPLAEAIRASLPEALRRPEPVGFPGVLVGEAPEDPLPRPKLLRVDAPSSREAALARAWLGSMAVEALGEQAQVEEAEARPEALHALRRAWRRIRYGLEALEYTWPGLARVREAVHRFVSILGAIQDRQVVRARVEALPPGEGAIRAEGRLDLLARLEREERELRTEARELARRKLAPAPWSAALAKGFSGPSPARRGRSRRPSSS